MNFDYCPACRRNDALWKPWIHQVDGLEYQTCFGLNRLEHLGKKYTFRTDTGEPLEIRNSAHSNMLSLMRRGKALECDVRGFPGDFLFKTCGVRLINRDDIGAVFPDNTALWMWAYGAQVHYFITMVSIQRGSDIVGFQLRAFPLKRGDCPITPDTVRTIGSAEGLYIPPFIGVLPSAVVIHEGIWGAVAAMWDAYEYQSDEIFSVAVLSASTKPETIHSTLELIFPGVPRFSVFDQDTAGIKLREKTLIIAKPITVNGAGPGKDYRDLIPGLRFERLSEIIRVELKRLDGGK
jgi:hypothetical protein